jgi:hypothetical protein
MNAPRKWLCRVALLGAALVFLVLASWLISRSRPMHTARSHSYLGLDRGRLYFGYTDGPADPRLLSAIADGVKASGSLRSRWLPRSTWGWGSSAASQGRFFYTLFAVPILPIAGVVAALTGLGFVVLCRRTPPGACAACGYDLRGVPAGRCPECGVGSFVARFVRRLLALAHPAAVRPG